jgi:hypothetical protein
VDDDDEIVIVTYERPSFPWEPSQMQADVLSLAADLTTRMAEFMDTMAARAAADSNFMLDQSEFAAEAAKQIETLTDEKTE